jgi:hypothetical protein
MQYIFSTCYNAGVMEFSDHVPTFAQWYQGRSEGKYSYDTAYDWMLYTMLVYKQSSEDMVAPAFFEAKTVLSMRKK